MCDKAEILYFIQVIHLNILLNQINNNNNNSKNDNKRNKMRTKISNSLWYHEISWYVYPFAIYRFEEMKKRHVQQWGSGITMKWWKINWLVVVFDKFYIFLCPMGQRMIEWHDG